MSARKSTRTMSDRDLVCLRLASAQISEQQP